MNNPIGIFDSGIGGISILDKLKDMLPNENYIYLADNLNCPYGNKSKDEITCLSIKNCEKLVELNCKIIIVACNTATTNSIEKMRKSISIPIVGIEPGLKPAIYYTKTKNIGVLATGKTLSSKLFFETLNSNKNENIVIHEQIGYQLVDMIEKTSYTNEDIYEILKSYLSPMINKNIDCLVLGCTHYHYLKSIIKDIIPNNVFIIDTITPVVNHVLNILKQKKILNNTYGEKYIRVSYNGNILSKKYISKSYKLSYLDF